MRTLLFFFFIIGYAFPSNGIKSSDIEEAIVTNYSDLEIDYTVTISTNTIYNRELKNMEEFVGTPNLKNRNPYNQFEKKWLSFFLNLNSSDSIQPITGSVNVAGSMFSIEAYGIVSPNNKIKSHWLRQLTLLKAAK